MGLQGVEMIVLGFNTPSVNSQKSEEGPREAHLPPQAVAAGRRLPELDLGGGRGQGRRRGRAIRMFGCQRHRQSRRRDRRRDAHRGGRADRARAAISMPPASARRRSSTSSAIAASSTMDGSRRRSAWCCRRRPDARSQPEFRRSRAAPALQAAVRAGRAAPDRAGDDAEPDGVVNAAPFSFFNVFSENPALIVLGLQHNADGTPKDTTRNIHVSGEFVVNLVDEAIAEAMNLTAIDFPPERERAGDGRPGARGLDAGEAAAAGRRARRLRVPAHGRPGLRPAARAADRRGAGRARARGHRRPRDASTSTSRRWPRSAACAATCTRASATCSSSSASPTPSGASSAGRPEAHVRHAGAGRHPYAFALSSSVGTAHGLRPSPQ